MKHQDGYCDECGAEARVVWLSLDGVERCQECAVGKMAPQVRVAAKPEARDDGR